MRKYNFRVYFLTLGCCEIETRILNSSVYDLSRLGIDIVSSPYAANVLVVGGWLNKKMIEEVKKSYQQMSQPKYVIAVGTCSISASTFQEKSKKLSDIIPVDIFAPGCPPRPEVYMDALLALREKIAPNPLHEEVLKSAIKSETIQV